jgi:hypothetical protein
MSGEKEQNRLRPRYLLRGHQLYHHRALLVRIKKPSGYYRLKHLAHYW